MTLPKSIPAARGFPVRKTSYDGPPTTTHSGFIRDSVLTVRLITVGMTTDIPDRVSHNTLEGGESHD